MRGAGITRSRAGRHKKLARKSLEGNVLGSAALGGKLWGLARKKELFKPSLTLGGTRLCMQQINRWVLDCIRSESVLRRKQLLRGELCTEAAKNIINYFARYMLLSKIGKDSLQNQLVSIGPKHICRKIKKHPPLPFPACWGIAMASSEYLLCLSAFNISICGASCLQSCRPLNAALQKEFAPAQQIKCFSSCLACVP